MLKQLTTILCLALAPTAGCAAEPTPAEADRIKQVAALTDQQVFERR